MLNKVLETEVTPAPTVEDCPPLLSLQLTIPEISDLVKSMTLRKQTSHCSLQPQVSFRKSITLQRKGKRKEATLNPNQSFPSARATDGMIGFQMSIVKYLNSQSSRGPGMLAAAISNFQSLTKT